MHAAVVQSKRLCNVLSDYNYNCTPIKTYSFEYSSLLFLLWIFILCSLHSFPQSVWSVVWTFGSSIRVPQNVYQFQCGHSANGYIENKVIKMLSHWLYRRHTHTYFFLYRKHWSRILELAVWGQNHRFTLNYWPNEVRKILSTSVVLHVFALLHFVFIRCDTTI